MHWKAFSVLFFSFVRKYTNPSTECTYSFWFVKTLFLARFDRASRGSTKLKRNLLTISLRSVFLHRWSFQGTFGHWPFGTFFIGRISLSDLFTFFFINFFTFWSIFFYLVFMVPLKRKSFKMTPNHVNQ